MEGDEGDFEVDFVGGGDGLDVVAFKDCILGGLALTVGQGR